MEKGKNTPKALSSDPYMKNPMIKKLQVPSALVYSVDSDMHPLKQFLFFNPCFRTEL